MLEMHLAQTPSRITISRSLSQASCILVCVGGSMGVIVILKLCNILYVLEIRHLFHGFKFNRSFDESLFGGIG